MNKIAKYIYMRWRCAALLLHAAIILMCQRPRTQMMNL